MARRGHSTVVGKFAKVHHDRRKSEIRVFGELLRQEQQQRQLAKQSSPENARL
jgi:hypothetical protein